MRVDVENDISQIFFFGILRLLYKTKGRDKTEIVSLK